MGAPSENYDLWDAIKMHPILAGTAVWFGILVFTQNDAGVGFYTFAFAFLSGFVLFVGLLVSIITTIIRWIIKTPQLYSRPFLHTWLPMLLLIGGCGVVVFRPMFYLRFYCSLPAIDKYVTAVQSDKVAYSGPQNLYNRKGVA